MRDVKQRLNPKAFKQSPKLDELSGDIRVISEEIQSYKQRVTSSIIEIGKRLKHVKENDLTRGRWLEWLASLQIEARQAQRFMQAFEQFGNTSASTHLESGKIIEMLTLPPEVDRAEFIEKKHRVPSTGDEKTVAEMSTREIREVVKEVRRAAGLVKEKKESPGASSSSDKLYSNSKPTIQQLIAELDSDSISDTDTEAVLHLLFARGKNSLVKVLARMGFEEVEEFVPIRATAEAHSGPRKVLGVSETASFDEIRKKYIGLMKSVHPDKGGSSYLCITVQAAYEELRDEEQRRNRGTRRPA